MTSQKFYETAEHGWRCYQSHRPIAVYDVETTGLKAEAAGITEGKAAGKAESVVELLEELGAVPQVLRKR